MEYESLLELVKQRRSIHRFKTDPIPDEYVEKILEVARWAPSGMNMQPWEFVVVKEPELRAQIVKYIDEDYKDLLVPVEQGNYFFPENTG